MIVIELTQDKYLVVHLKMTGQLIFVDIKGKAFGGGHPIESKEIEFTKPNKYTHVILNFKDGSRLLYNDVRKFGWLKLMSKEEYNILSNRHGIEPLAKEFTLSRFKEILKKRPNSKIKQFLLNQELIVGLGNIYVDESLFKAKIKPFRRVYTLKGNETDRLYKAIKLKLFTAIKFGGTSVNTFVSISGERGKFVNKLKVYGRGGMKCLRCKNELTKIKMGGRGTVYCTKCQK